VAEVETRVNGRWWRSSERLSYFLYWKGFKCALPGKERVRAEWASFLPVWLQKKQKTDCILERKCFSSSSEFAQWAFAYTDPTCRPSNSSSSVFGEGEHTACYTYTPCVVSFACPGIDTGVFCLIQRTRQTISKVAWRRSQAFVTKVAGSSVPPNFYSLGCVMPRVDCPCSIKWLYNVRYLTLVEGALYRPVGSVMARAA
jgi:hypothetical protein